MSDPTSLHPVRLDSLTARPCTWAAAVNTSRSATGVTIGGEFSGATTDCGFWLNGITAETGASGSIMTCGDWDDYRKWDATKKADIKKIVLASMDAIQDFFFWTWKIGVSKTRGCEFSRADETQSQGVGLTFVGCARARSSSRFLSGVALPVRAFEMMGECDLLVLINVDCCC